MKKIMKFASMTLMATLAFTGCKKESNNRVEKTQDDLYSEMLEIVEDSLGQYVSIEAKFKGGNNVKSSYTKDSNGIYYVNYDDNSEVNLEMGCVKQEGRYIYYTKTPQVAIARYVDYEEYLHYSEDALEFSDVLNPKGIFDASNLDELKEIIIDDVIVEEEGKFPIEPEIKLTKEFNKKISKNVLTLEIFVNYKVENDDEDQYIIVVECYDNLIRNIKVSSTAESSISEYEISYIVNSSIVKTDFSGFTFSE